MKTYTGQIIDGCAFVTVLDPSKSEHAIQLPMRLDLRNHSPSGFAWGYGGSGPSQLALALCADALGDDLRAQTVYMEYKWKYIATIPWNKEKWTMTDDEIRLRVKLLENPTDPKAKKRLLGQINGLLRNDDNPNLSRLKTAFEADCITYEEALSEFHRIHPFGKSPAEEIVKTIAEDHRVSR